MRRTAITAAFIAMLAACGQQPNAAHDAASSTAAPAGPRFVDREAFTIVYALSGVQTGTITEHTRDWGARKATIKDAKISLMGISQADQSRDVVEGPEIYKLDPTTGKWSVMTNPIYDGLVGAMDGKTGVEFGKELMTRLGGKPTGETGSFAGQACAYYELATAKTCVTDWGASLHVSYATAGFTIDQKATEVRIGDGGPDTAFEVDKAAAERVELPDLDVGDIQAGAKALEALTGN